MNGYLKYTKHYKWVWMNLIWKCNLQSETTKKWLTCVSIEHEVYGFGCILDKDWGKADVLFTFTFYSWTAGGEMLNDKITDVKPLLKQT